MHLNNRCMYIYIYIYMYIHICMYIYIHIYTCIHTSFSLSLSIYMCIYIYIYMCTHVYRCVTNKHNLPGLQNPTKQVLQLLDVVSQEPWTKKVDLAKTNNKSTTNIR